MIALCFHGPCSKRSGNAQELFGDVAKKDICTAPTCFKAKVSAAWTCKAECALEHGVFAPNARLRKSEGADSSSAHPQPR